MEDAAILARLFELLSKRTKKNGGGEAGRKERGNKAAY